MALLAALLPKVTNEPSQNRHISQPVSTLLKPKGIDAALIHPYSGHATPPAPGDLLPPRPRRHPATPRLPRLTGTIIPFGPGNTFLTGLIQWHDTTNDKHVTRWPARTEVIRHSTPATRQEPPEHTPACSAPNQLTLPRPWPTSQAAAAPCAPGAGKRSHARSPTRLVSWHSSPAGRNASAGSGLGTVSARSNPGPLLACALRRARRCPIWEQSGSGEARSDRLRRGDPDLAWVADLGGRCYQARLTGGAPSCGPGGRGFESPRPPEAGTAACWPLADCAGSPRC